MLPMPAVVQFLDELCTTSPDWATPALLAARDLVLLRPPSRAPVLRFVLRVACATDADARAKAVRLLANRLFPEATLSTTIQHEATQQLDSLVAGSSHIAAAVEGAGDESARSADNDDAAAALAKPTDAQQPQPGPSEEDATRSCALYCALCTKKHSLLRHLFEIYGLTPGAERGGTVSRTCARAYPSVLHVPLAV